VLIVTDFRTSTTALDVVSTSMHGIGEIGHPVFAATQVMARPGTNPTISVPVVDGRALDVETIWAYLAEPAEFFGFAMPDRDGLSDAIAQFIATVGRSAAAKIFALSITIAELEGSAQFVVAGSEVRFTRSEAVRIDVCDVAFPLTRSADPLWRRMAARTTSRGEADQLRRWLEDRGYVDGLSCCPASDVPFLGALVFGRGADVCGVDNAEPTSILTQLQECEAIAPIRRADGCPVDAERVWWISPGYEVHPVAAIGADAYAVDEAAPSFSRIR
jgi:hypothetical protein